MLLELPQPTTIAEGSQILGNLNFSSQAQIFGIVEGEVIQQSSDTLHVGQTGWVQGSISSQGAVVIEGRVDGNVHSLTQIRLLASATVQGTLVAPNISIQPGAIVNGDFVMRWAKERCGESKHAA